MAKQLSCKKGHEWVQIKWFSVGALVGFTRGWAGELSIKQPIVDQHDAPDQVTTHIHWTSGSGLN